MLILPPYKHAADDQEAVYDYTVPLGDASYRVVLTHCTRQDRWYMSLYDADDAILIHRVFLAVDIFLLEDLEIEGLPPGELALFDTSESGAECGFDDLGNRCELIYLEPEDLSLDPGPPNVTIEAA